MPVKKKLSFVEKLLLLKKAGIESSPVIVKGNQPAPDFETIDELQNRINAIMGVFKPQNQKPGQMIYFVMYDIENNKVRTYISKYLVKKGCIRVQKSIFLADSSRPEFNDIHQTLKEVQEVYDNYDSIMLVPVATDQLRGMKIIGKNIDLDLFLGNKNTLFF